MEKEYKNVLYVQVFNKAYDGMEMYYQVSLQSL